MSHHLRILTGRPAQREKRGVWAYYRLVPSAIAAIAELLTRPASGDEEDPLTITPATDAAPVYAGTAFRRGLPPRGWGGLPRVGGG